MLEYLVPGWWFAWMGLGDVAWIEGVHHCGQTLRTESRMQFPVCFLYFVLVG